MKKYDVTHELRNILNHTCLVIQREFSHQFEILYICFSRDRHTKVEF